jgi:hypothetical protein
MSTNDAIEKSQLARVRPRIRFGQRRMGRQLAGHPDCDEGEAALGSPRVLVGLFAP